jgi:hypothetical protein
MVKVKAGAKFMTIEPAKNASTIAGLSSYSAQRLSRSAH